MTPEKGRMGREIISARDLERLEKWWVKACHALYGITSVGKRGDACVAAGNERISGNTQCGHINRLSLNRTLGNQMEPVYTFLFLVHNLYSDDKSGNAGFVL